MGWEEPRQAMGRNSTLRIRPVTLKEANALVARLHRHHPPDQGHKWSVGVESEDQLLCGAAIIGRPKSRGLDKRRPDARFTAEVTRVVTDGTPNACSALYGAAARCAEAMGYDHIITYLRDDEQGVSLVAAGWEFETTVTARSWDCPSRRRRDTTERVPRQRWGKRLYPGRRRKR